MPTARPLARQLLSLAPPPAVGPRPDDNPEDKKGKPAVKTFVNSKDGLTGELAKHYVDFSFDYPAAWAVEDSRKAERSFVKIENMLTEGNESLTLENFSVGPFYLSGDIAADKKLFPKLIEQLKAATKAGFPDPKFTFEGLSKLGEYKCYEIKFSCVFDIPKRGKVEMFGFYLLVPNPNDVTKGVVIACLGTNKAPGLKGVEDLGVKGELPVVLKSFKFKKN